MRVVKNEAYMKRNGRIGQALTLGALIVLGLGMYLSLKRVDLFAYSIAALIVGFTMTQVGMSLSSRFGRSPRPDERLDAGLKGLPGDTTIYHYVTRVPHVLVGPMGVWVLLPFHQKGQIVFDRNRWRIHGGGFMQAYMSLFGQEGIGRPEADAAAQVRSLRRQISQQYSGSDLPEIRALLIFTNDEAEVDQRDSPIPAVHLRKLKDFIRHQPRDTALGGAAITGIQQLLDES